MNLKFLVWPYREYIIGCCIEDVPCGYDFDCVLAILRSYGYDTNASEAVEKITLDEKNSLIKNVLTSFDDDAEFFKLNFLVYLPAQIFIMDTKNPSLLLSFEVTHKLCFKLFHRSYITR